MFFSVYVYDKLSKLKDNHVFQLYTTHKVMSVSRFIVTILITIKDVNNNTVLVKIMVAKTYDLNSTRF